MNELAVLEKVLPRSTMEYLKVKGRKDSFAEVNCFDDIERIFLKGAGLQPQTYRSYICAVRQLYDYMQAVGIKQIDHVLPQHIEDFYDHLVKRVNRNTAYLRIAGVKKFLRGVQKVRPDYVPPFEYMTDKLKKKISKTKKRGTKAALRTQEIKKILDYLAKDQTTRGKEDFALIFMLVTSGLRANELCQLRWCDIGEDDTRFTAHFIGKGDRESEQEIYAPALEATREYFVSQFGRNPKPDEHLFWTIPIDCIQDRHPIPYQTLYLRIKKIGKAITDKEIVKRQLQWSPHLMRRSYATMLYESGMKLKAIQGKTRHSNMQTLTEHYIDDSEKATPYLQAIFAT